MDYVMWLFLHEIELLDTNFSIKDKGLEPLTSGLKVPRSTD